ncbi:hypothetical protein GWK47_008655 [Chionoecetes opilio]|uniref:Uncharacterized protein n=1 Tax=Chionoecetes opilio TaxID=41210 RepID=A0A8J5CNH8_CHIOP|nr:hypothetical protein GWK47_008655 [Chionoecetes opilio]
MGPSSGTRHRRLQPIQGTVGFIDQSRRSRQTPHELAAHPPEQAGHILGGVGPPVQHQPNPRDDYKEMLELFIVLLGGEGRLTEGEVPATGRHAPRALDGACHLRPGKIMLFAAQLGSSARRAKISSLRRFTFFVAEGLRDPLVRGGPWPPSRRRMT